MGESSVSTDSVPYCVHTQAHGTSWPLTFFDLDAMSHIYVVYKTIWRHHLTLDPCLDITLAVSEGTPALCMLRSDGTCKILVHATIKIGYFHHFLLSNAPP
jgi:hypothetical protein